MRWQEGITQNAMKNNGLRLTNSRFEHVLLFKLSAIDALWLDLHLNNKYYV